MSVFNILRQANTPPAMQQEYTILQPLADTIHPPTVNYSTRFSQDPEVLASVRTRLVEMTKRFKIDMKKEPIYLNGRHTCSKASTMTAFAAMGCAFFSMLSMETAFPFLPIALTNASIGLSLTASLTGSKSASDQALVEGLEHTLIILQGEKRNLQHHVLSQTVQRVDRNVDKLQGEVAELRDVITKLRVETREIVEILKSERNANGEMQVQAKVNMIVDEENLPSDSLDTTGGTAGHDAEQAAGLPVMTEEEHQRALFILDAVIHFVRIKLGIDPPPDKDHPCLDDGCALCSSTGRICRDFTRCIGRTQDACARCLGCIRDPCARCNHCSRTGCIGCIRDPCARCNRCSSTGCICRAGTGCIGCICDAWAGSNLFSCAKCTVCNSPTCIGCDSPTEAESSVEMA